MVSWIFDDDIDKKKTEITPLTEKYLLAWVYWIKAENPSKEKIQKKVISQAKAMNMSVSDFSEGIRIGKEKLIAKREAEKENTQKFYRERLKDDRN